MLRRGPAGLGIGGDLHASGAAEATAQSRPAHGGDRYPLVFGDKMSLGGDAGDDDAAIGISGVADDYRAGGVVASAVVSGVTFYFGGAAAKARQQHDLAGLA